LLEALERARIHVEYYALDLSRLELQRTFAELDLVSYKYVTFNALHGTYRDGLVWLTKPENQSKAKCIVSLGSSIGNFTREEAAKFLSTFRALLGPTDLIIVGLDSCQDPRRVYAAYNDSQGITEQFYRNGLDHANKVLGYQAFKQREWAIGGVYDDVDHKHHAFFVALTDVKNGDMNFRKGEKVDVEYAYKYSKEQSDKLWREAGLVNQSTYSTESGDGRMSPETPYHPDH
jgi:EasF-like predicted methyltransferase